MMRAPPVADAPPLVSTSSRSSSNNNHNSHYNNHDNDNDNNNNNLGSRVHAPASAPISMSSYAALAADAPPMLRRLSTLYVNAHNHPTTATASASATSTHHHHSTNQSTTRSSPPPLPPPLPPPPPPPPSGLPHHGSVIVEESHFGSTSATTTTTISSGVVGNMEVGAGGGRNPRPIIQYSHGGNYRGRGRRGSGGRSSSSSSSNYPPPPHYYGRATEDQGLLPGVHPGGRSGSTSGHYTRDSVSRGGRGGENRGKGEFMDDAASESSLGSSNASGGGGGGAGHHSSYWLSNGRGGRGRGHGRGRGRGGIGRGRGRGRGRSDTATVWVGSGGAADGDVTSSGGGRGLFASMDRQHNPHDSRFQPSRPWTEMQSRGRTERGGDAVDDSKRDMGRADRSESYAIEQVTHKNDNSFHSKDFRREGEMEEETRRTVRGNARHFVEQDGYVEDRSGAHRERNHYESLHSNPYKPSSRRDPQEDTMDYVEEISSVGPRRGVYSDFGTASPDMKGKRYRLDEVGNTSGVKDPSSYRGGENYPTSFQSTQQYPSQPGDLSERDEVQHWTEAFPKRDVSGHSRRSYARQESQSQPQPQLQLRKQDSGLVEGHYRSESANPNCSTNSNTQPLGSDHWANSEGILNANERSRDESSTFYRRQLNFSSSQQELDEFRAGSGRNPNVALGGRRATRGRGTRGRYGRAPFRGGDRVGSISESDSTRSMSDYRGGVDSFRQKSYYSSDAGEGRIDTHFEESSHLSQSLAPVEDHNTGDHIYHSSRNWHQSDPQLERSPLQPNRRLLSNSALSSPRETILTSSSPQTRRGFVARGELPNHASPRPPLSTAMSPQGRLTSVHLQRSSPPPPLPPPTGTPLAYRNESSSSTLVPSTPLSPPPQQLLKQPSFDQVYECDPEATIQEQPMIIEVKDYDEEPTLLSSHPPRSSPCTPTPADPSPLVLATTRLIDLEAQLEFAFVKHMQLMMEQQKRRVRCKTLERLGVGMEAFPELEEEILKEVNVQLNN